MYAFLASMGLLLGLPAAALAAAAPPAAAPAANSPLTTDLSSHLISITSSFTGTDLLLFGAVEEPGDIVVVVRGPTQSVVVRRKGRVAGIWLNREAINFAGVPGYYAVAATRPFQQIASQALLARLQIGTENLRLLPQSSLPETETQPYREAIVRAKTRQGLYQDYSGRVVFLGQRLFRARISFPALVPVGIYRTEVYLVRDDQVISAQSTPLYVKKTGLERTVYDFAHKEPLFYGIGAVLLAISAGWIAASLFRKS